LLCFYNLAISALEVGAVTKLASDVPSGTGLCGSGGVLWTCSIFPLFGPKGAQGTVLPARRCGNIQLSAFACADRSAALAIAALGTATKFNERAEHFRPATLEVRIPL
jgi:hypothetical protein